MDNRILDSNTHQQIFADEILQASQALFWRLTASSDSFECDEFIIKMLEYLEKFYRIQYSSLSAIVYRSNDNIRTNIGINLTALVDYSQTKGFDDLFDEAKEDKKETTKRILVKLWDHYNLANAQFSDLVRDGFYETFLKEKEQIQKEYKEQINNEGRKLNRDLIAMVAIFTAMSFLVFGGLSSLSSILSLSIKELPVLTIGVECLVWGICVYNLIYLFMYLVGKLIDKQITSRDSDKFYKRHAIFLIGNGIIFSALLVTGWLYFIQTDFSGWYTQLYHYMGVYTKFLPVFLAVGVLAIILIARLVIKCKKAIIKCHYIRKWNQPVIVKKDAVYSIDGELLEKR